MTDRPNIIVFMTDQQRGDCLSLNGHPVLLTPNMDYIAASGVNFTRAYSTCPSCTPARQTFLTGRSPSTNGYVGMGGEMPWEPDTTLPRILSKAGYQTAIVGKGLHQYKPAEHYGFEYAKILDTRYGAKVESDQVPDEAYGNWSHGLSRNGWTARPWHLPEWMHFTHRTINDALDFIDARDETRPFFLVITFVAPHPPFNPPAFYMDRYLRQNLPQPTIGSWARPPKNGGKGLHIESPFIDIKGEALQSFMAGYFGLINHVDDQIYRILGKRPRLPDNTYMALCSDHGEMLGDHHLQRKTYAYESSARIPFAINGPGIVQDQTSDVPISLEDFAPTMLDLLGLDVPDTMEGRSLKPILTGMRKDIGRTHIHGEHARIYRRKDLAHHFLTDGKRKYIWFSHTGREQFFDLERDPREMRDLSKSLLRKNEIRRWRKRLIGALQDRPEGFSDGKRLIAGRPHGVCVPNPENLTQQALAEPARAE